jgi:hypothetical protein
MAISGRNLSWNRTAYNVSGYGVEGTDGRWSGFMDSNAISFVPSSAPVGDVNGESYSGTAQVTLSQAGTYKIKVAADNQAESSATFDGQSLSIGDLNTAGSETSYTVAVGEAPKTVTLSITIGNQFLADATNFAENPTGMAILINEPDTINETVGDPNSDCPPGPWVPAIPPCSSQPGLVSNTNNGLQIKKSGSSSVTLNLKNYPNQLVTLKVVHQRSGEWQNGFSFDIPNASDITAGGTPLGGSIYNRSGYSNSDISGTTTFYLYNLDGGDYNYTFTHSSTPNPASRPTRTLFTLTPLTSESIDGDGNLVITTTYSCEPSGTEQYSPWPPCTPAVAITKNGGNEVGWCYEDGGGTPFCDQTVTITVEDVRDAIPQSGGICMSDIKDKVWVADSGDGGADGSCLSEYRDHSTKLRFRIPSIQSSKTSLPDPLCFTDFRGIAGAKTPGEMGIP